MSATINALGDRSIFIDNSVVVTMVNESRLSLKHKEKLRKLIEKYRYVFSVSDNDVGEYEGEEIEVDLEDNEPVYISLRPIPYALHE